MSESFLYHIEWVFNLHNVDWVFKLFLRLSDSLNLYHVKWVFEAFSCLRKSLTCTILSAPLCCSRYVCVASAPILLRQKEITLARCGHGFANSLDGLDFSTFSDCGRRSVLAGDVWTLGCPPWGMPISAHQALGFAIFDDVPDDSVENISVVVCLHRIISLSQR